MANVGMIWPPDKCSFLGLTNIKHHNLGVLTVLQVCHVYVYICLYIYRYVCTQFYVCIYIWYAPKSTTAIKASWISAAPCPMCPFQVAAWDLASIWSPHRGACGWSRSGVIHGKSPRYLYIYIYIYTHELYMAIYINGTQLENISYT
jgi:hypothetical protein